MTTPDASDLVERLREPIIGDAFDTGRIVDGALAERIVLERGQAAAEISRLREKVREGEGLLERSQYWSDDAGLSMWREDVRDFFNKEQEQ